MTKLDARDRAQLVLADQTGLTTPRTVIGAFGRSLR